MNVLPEEKTPRRWDVAIVCGITAIVLTIGGISLKNNHDANEKERERIDSLRAERDQRIATEQKLNEMLIQASRDSAEAADRPTYDDDDIEKLVRKVVPSSSTVYLWKCDNHKWIMKYTLTRRGKEIMCFRCFDPTDKKLGPEDVVRQLPDTNTNTYIVDERYITRYKSIKSGGIYAENSLSYWLSYNDKKTGYMRWDSEGIRNRIPGKSKPLPYNYDDDDDDLEGYEDAEDFYYDNAEDLYLYYNGEY